MGDPVSRDAQRHQAQFLVDEDIGPAHREVARARPIRGKADMPSMMGGHETDECSRPAERAVDPGLVGLLYYLEYGLVVGGQTTFSMTALSAAHLMVVTAVRLGCAARSTPAPITGQGYCARSLRTTYSHAAGRWPGGFPGRRTLAVSAGGSTVGRPPVGTAGNRNTLRPVGHLADSALSRCGHVRWEYCRAWSFVRLGVQVGFFSRLFVPRSVRRAMHPGRAVKRAVTPKAVKRASRALHPIDNAVYSIQRSAATAIRWAASARLPFPGMEIVLSAIGAKKLRPNAGTHSHQGRGFYCGGNTRICRIQRALPLSE